MGRPVVEGFVGNMDYYRAKKGVILTTSEFTKDGVNFVDRIEGKKVALIDGLQLVELMMEHNVGVKGTKTYELKTVSDDFFEEDAGLPVEPRVHPIRITTCPACVPRAFPALGSPPAGWRWRRFPVTIHDGVPFFG